MEHDRDDEDDRATTEPGGEGPGRYSKPADAGEPLSEEGTETGTSPGTPGEHEEPDAGGPNPSPRREQPGL